MTFTLKYWLSAVREAVRSAMHSLWSHKLRSGLTLLSILIGVATMIILVSIIGGLDRKIAGEFASLGTNVLYLSRRPWTGSGSDWHKWRNNPRITMRELNAAKKCTNADRVVPRLRTHRTVGFEQNSMDVTVYGTSWEFCEMQRMDIEFGRFFSYGEDRRGRPVCVIGWDVYENLLESGDIIGKWIRIGAAPYRIVGVIKKQGQSMTMGTMDNNVYIPFNAFLHHLGGRWGLSVMVSANDAGKVDELREELRSVIRGARKLKPWQDDNFAINSQDMLLDEYHKITRILWTAILAIAALALIVGGIGVMNIMLITVTERTREIGVRKALGATKSHILGQFILEALTQCWLGGILGFISGILLPFFVSRVVKQLPFALSWEAAGIAIGFTSIVGIVFGLYPAYKAAKLSPVEALRYE